MLFTPRLIATTKADGKTVLNEGGLFGQPISIVPRAYSSFRRYRLRGTGKAAVKAVEVQAKHEARLGHDMFIVRKETNNEYASVWGFNSQYVSGLRRLPESLCRKSMTNGVRLVKCISGIEGQVWHESQLVASRWWHDQPSSENWDSFLRAAPIELKPSDMAKPKVVTPEFRRDLSPFSMDLDNLEQVLNPVRIGTFVFCISLFFVSQFTIQNYRFRSHLFQIENQKANISKEANQILSKRRRAIANAKKLQKFETLEPKYSLIGALAAVATTFKGQDVVLRDVRLRNGEVEFKLTGSALLRASDMVTELEKTASLSAVNVTGNRNNILIKAQLASLTSHSLSQSSRGEDQ
jgi:hypothetical protein